MNNKAVLENTIVGIFILVVTLLYIQIYTNVLKNVSLW